MRALLLILLSLPGLAWAEPGSIRGRVSYDGPAPTQVKVAVDVNPEICGKSEPLLADRIVVGQGRGLAHVAVILVGITERAPQKRGAKLTQRNCTFLPHLQTITVGSPLSINNEDPVVHNVHARIEGETVFNLGMPLKGTQLTRKLDRPGLIDLSCDSGHTWMRAYLVVVPHSYHATTAADGSFAITGVAPGSYTLRTWHETLGVIDTPVTISADNGAEPRITYRPRSAPTGLPSLDFAALPTQAVIEVETSAPALPDLPAGPGPAVAAELAAAHAQRDADVALGQGLFRRHCAGCHGDLGNGRGEAIRWLESRPRDFTKGVLKLRSTPSGSTPLVEDLVRTIGVGIPGTEMPAFAKRIGPSDRRRLARYVLTFSDRFLRPPDEPIEIPPEPKSDSKSIARGRQIYGRLLCAQCHGPSGAADGVSKSMVDDFGQPIRAADLTLGIYKSGEEPTDLYRTLMTGLSGTPMPAFADLLTSDEIWDLVHYLRSLAAGRGFQDFLGVP